MHKEINQLLLSYKFMSNTAFDMKLQYPITRISKN